MGHFYVQIGSMFSTLLHSRTFRADDRAFLSRTLPLPVDRSFLFEYSRSRLPRLCHSITPSSSGRLNAATFLPVLDPSQYRRRNRDDYKEKVRSIMSS